MTSGRPHIAWTDAQLKRMRAIVESGDLTLADIGRRFRCSEHEIRRQTIAGGWTNPNAEKVKPKAKTEVGIISRPSATFLHNRPPGGMPIEAALQSIAMVAHNPDRGALLNTTYRRIPGGDLMRALRGAWKATEGHQERRTRVETIIRAMAAKIAPGEPLLVSPANLGLLRSFAGIETVKRKARAAA